MLLQVLASMVFSILVSNYSLLVYRNKIDFCMLALYPCYIHLLVLGGFFVIVVHSSEFSVWTMSSVNREFSFFSSLYVLKIFFLILPQSDRESPRLEDRKWPFVALQTLNRGERWGTMRVASLVAMETASLGPLPTPQDPRLRCTSCQPGSGPQANTRTPDRRSECGSRTRCTLGRRAIIMLLYCMDLVRLHLCVPNSFDEGGERTFFAFAVPTPRTPNVRQESGMRRPNTPQ